MMFKMGVAAVILGLACGSASGLAFGDGEGAPVRDLGPQESADVEVQGPAPQDPEPPRQDDGPELAPPHAVEALAWTWRRARATSRMIELLLRYASASPADREEAAAILAQARSVGTGSQSPPPLEGVDRALAALHSDRGEASRDDDAQDLAYRSAVQSLELSVEPGTFASREQGRGEAMTVRLVQRYDAPPPGDVMVQLTWIGPGGETVHARRERATAEVFAGRGFEMYIRPPVSEPGTWRLEADGFWSTTGRLEDLDGPRGAEVLRSALVHPLRVECAEAPLDRIAAIGARGRSLGPLGIFALSRINHWSGHGGPWHAALSGEELWAAGEGEASTDPVRVAELAPGKPSPMLPLFENQRGEVEWLWGLRGDAEPTSTVVLCVPSWMSTEGPFIDPLRQRWVQLANERSALVLAMHLPMTRLDPPVEAVLAGVRTQGPDGPWIGVAEGDAVTRLQLALFGKDPQPFDALVFSTVMERGNPGRVLPELPRLFVTPVGDAAWRTYYGEARPERFHWAEGDREPLWNALVLAERLEGAWGELVGAVHDGGETAPVDGGEGDEGREP